MLDRVEHCTEFSFLALSCAPFPLTFGLLSVWYNLSKFIARRCFLKYQKTSMQERPSGSDVPTHASTSRFTAITSLTEPARNVFALSLNKTYKKYCWCRGVCALGRSAWNITKRVSSGENYLQFSYILLKIIILYYSTRLMGLILQGGRGWRDERCLHGNLEVFHLLTEFQPEWSHVQPRLLNDTPLTTHTTVTLPL